MPELTGYEQDVEDVKEYYASLLILQYRNKPKARETIKLGAELFLGDGLVFQLQDILDVDKAVGDWLDLIGKLVGAPRNVPNMGLLDDDNYRLLIKFKIAYNVMRASNKDMDDALFSLFGTQILLNNNQDLSITYIVNEDIEDAIKAALILGYLTSPAGIEFAHIIQVPDTLKIFGFNSTYFYLKPIGLSTKDTLREGQFLTKDNIIAIEDLI